MHSFIHVIRRGKAYGFVWEMDLAEKDLVRVKELDPSLASLVDKDLAFFQKRFRENEKNQMKKLAGKMC